MIFFLPKFDKTFLLKKKKGLIRKILANYQQYDHIGETEIFSSKLLSLDLKG